LVCSISTNSSDTNGVFYPVPPPLYTSALFSCRRCFINTSFIKRIVQIPRSN